jgi:UDP-3-O-[3-hydroxymyristoyl] N-acetylglucosamine deacetylase / 3-hydroxyacyl-[acyl-carrier-protein] dehydratase
MKRKTIEREVILEGIGLHTGDKISMKLIPSESLGIKFKRTDLETPIIINADPNNVTKTSRSTTISNDGVSISTVEHFLAASYSLGIDCLIVEVSGEEIPILDGSSAPFIKLFKEAGTRELEEEKDVIVIDETITVRDILSGSEIIAMPSDQFELHVMIDFPGAAVTEQSAGIHGFEAFETEVAPCRTFVFTNELPYLFENNLIKGGDLSNALVIAEKGMTQNDLDLLTNKLGIEKHTVNSNGLINNTELLFQNELARHKLLDLIGDLALLGKSIQGKIIAIKPGHKINNDFTRMLKKRVLEQRKLKGKPHYDPDQEPIKDIEAIKSMLPHRYPFLLVDKIIELSDSHVVGVKNVTFNESFFMGHFPGNPVFPGVLQLEALAQTGGILALSTVPDPGNWDTYFLKIDSVKFKAKVVPGDTLLLKMELLSPIRRGIIHMLGTAYVGNKIVSEGELTAQIVRRNV